MSDLLDVAMDWVRSGSVRPDPTIIADVTLADEARRLAEAFTGPEGRERLMTFAKLTVLRPPVDHRLPGAERVAYAQLRQGQDSIFAALVHLLDIHEANQRSPDHGHERTAATEPRPLFPWSAGDTRDADAADPRFTGGGGWDAAGLIAGG